VGHSTAGPTTWCRSGTHTYQRHAPRTHTKSSRLHPAVLTAISATQFSSPCWPLLATRFWHQPWVHHPSPKGCTLLSPIQGGVRFMATVTYSIRHDPREYFLQAYTLSSTLAGRPMPLLMAFVALVLCHRVVLVCGQACRAVSPAVSWLRPQHEPHSQAYLARLCSCQHV